MIFASPVADALFKAWLLVYLLVNVIQFVVWLAPTLRDDVGRRGGGGV